jgi:hypothetical protein
VLAGRLLQKINHTVGCAVTLQTAEVLVASEVFVCGCNPTATLSRRFEDNLARLPVDMGGPGVLL